MAKKPFQDSRTRLNWAKNDIASFERSSRKFFQRTSFEVVREVEPSGSHELHKFRLAKALPLTLTRRVISAVENMRAALEYAAVTVGRLYKAPELELIHFPFCAKPADIKSRINSAACKDLPQEIKALFTSFEPYKGGDDPLWAINEVCNTSKHRLLLPVAAQSGVRMQYMESSDVLTQPIVLTEGVSDCADNEVVFARTQPGLKWKYHLKVAFGIAFGEVEAVRGRPVYPNLLLMLERATAVVDATETKCREIGLL